MSLYTLQNLENTLREEFAEQLRRVDQERDGWKAIAEQVEKDRDAWKSKCEEQEIKIQNLESFRNALKIQTTDLVEQNESPRRSKASTKAKLEPPVTSPVSDISSASTTHIQKLERNIETLKRKYDNLDNLYREAKRQNLILKTELAVKTKQWREWYQWWNIQRQTFRVKSTSPPKQPNRPIQTLETENEPQYGKAESDITDRQDVTLGRDNAEVMKEEGYFRITFRTDAVAVRQETQSIVLPEIPDVKPSASITRTDSSEQLPISKPNESKARKLVADNSMEEILQIRDILQATEIQCLQTSSKPEIIENIEIPESPISNPHRSSLSNEPRSVNIGLSPRSKSAPAKRSRASNSSTPLPTRTSGKKSKKRNYPNMKLYTEDGTDGINPRTPSPVEPEDDGRLMAMLEGPPPEAPGNATPTSLSTRKQSLTTTTIPGLKEPTAKAGRVRDFIELSSDGECGEISTPPERTQKRQKVESEPRLPRQIISPDLALKNKGRGRYSSSFLPRNPGDPPRLEDFVINPKNNQGIPYAFNDVVRGKAARKSLDATSCPDCEEFYRLHGPSAGAIPCNHRGDQHIQKVGKHRGRWQSKSLPPGFWDSDFRTEQQLAEDREEAEKRKAERVRHRAEEAAREDGRWKKKDT